MILQKNSKKAEQKRGIQPKVAKGTDAAEGRISVRSVQNEIELGCMGDHDTAKVGEEETMVEVALQLALALAEFLLKGKQQRLRLTILAHRLLRHHARGVLQKIEVMRKKADRDRLHAPLCVIVRAHERSSLLDEGLRRREPFCHPRAVILADTRILRAKAGEIFEMLLGANPYEDLKEAGYEFRPIEIGE